MKYLSEIKVCNELPGIEEYNDLEYITCFHHALICCTGFYGYDVKDLLMRDFLFYRQNLGAFKSKRAEKSLCNTIGLKLKRVNVTTLDTICEAIDRRTPIIVGVDCFYLPSRPDMFLKNHASHFILIFGYDHAEQEFLAVDSNYENSFNYEKKRISYSEIIGAAQYYKKSNLSKRHNGMLVYKGKHVDVGLPKKIKDVQSLQKNLNHIKKNIQIFRDAFTVGQRKLSKIEVQAANFLQYLKMCKIGLLHSDFFEKYFPELKKAEEESIKNITMLMGVFWKMNRFHDYENYIQKQTTIFSKLDLWQQQETEFFEGIIKKVQNHEI